jgi:hypothetical protein
LERLRTTVKEVKIPGYWLDSNGVPPGYKLDALRVRDYRTNIFMKDEN